MSVVGGVPGVPLILTSTNTIRDGSFSVIHSDENQSDIPTKLLSCTYFNLYYVMCVALYLSKCVCTVCTVRTEVGGLQVCFYFRSITSQEEAVPAVVPGGVAVYPP